MEEEEIHEKKARDECDIDQSPHGTDCSPAGSVLPPVTARLAQAAILDSRPAICQTFYAPGMAHAPPWDRICIRTKRLFLRTPTPEDAGAMHELFADPMVMHGLNRNPVSDLDGARAMIEGGLDGWRSDGVGPFILETFVDRRAVGWAGVMIFDTRGWTPSSWRSAGPHAQPELGWALMRAHWGCGYATEAAAAIRDWAYECRPIDLLVSLISPANVRSQHVARSIGAVPTETITPADTMQQTIGWRHSPAA